MLSRSVVNTSTRLADVNPATAERNFVNHTHRTSDVGIYMPLAAYRLLGQGPDTSTSFGIWNKASAIVLVGSENSATFACVALPFQPTHE